MGGDYQRTAYAKYTDTVKTSGSDGSEKLLISQIDLDWDVEKLCNLLEVTVSGKAGIHTGAVCCRLPSALAPLLLVLERKFTYIEKRKERKDAKMLIVIISRRQDVGRLFFLCMYFCMCIVRMYV